MAAAKKPTHKPSDEALARVARTGRAPGNPGNSGGKKGRSGRPPKAWKVFCRELIEDAAVQQAVRTRAEMGDPQILKLVAEHGDGLPEQPITVTTLTEAERAARVAELLKRAEARRTA
jgi:hypothetical protein